MKKQTGSIKGNNNIQVIGGDYITTQQVIRKTEVVHDADLHISVAQAFEIQSRIKKIAESLLNSSENPHRATYAAFNKKFKITSYKLLPKEKFDEAIKWLNKQIAIHRPKLKNVDEDEWRKDMYKAIHARARQLKLDVHVFATDALELKKPILSLKELSDRRLKTLYSKLFAIR